MFIRGFAKTAFNMGKLPRLDSVQPRSLKIPSQNKALQEASTGLKNLTGAASATNVSTGGTFSTGKI